MTESELRRAIFDHCQRLGWRLIRVTQEMVKSGMAIELIERALGV